MMYRTLTALSTFALLALVLAGCSNDTARGNGTLQVRLTDAPIDLTQVSAVNVTLTGVTVKAGDDPDDDGVDTDLRLTASTSMTINLLDFQNGNSVVIAAGDLPAGTYDHIRLHITDAELVRDDDGDPMTPEVVEPIFNPSNKVDVPVPFTVTPGDEMTITLDFDAALSVQVNQTPGQHPYILRPVINLAGMS